MPVNPETYKLIITELNSKDVTLVAVSKTKPAEEILALYDLGQRDFGENYVIELTEKYEQLPNDIHWHFIGHLQSNKVKYIAPFVSLIQGVDSKKLLIEIDKQGIKNNRVINCLLQVHIAKEETKFGLDQNELHELLSTNFTNYTNISIRGLMGMASLTDDISIIRSEFKFLKSLFDKYFIQNIQKEDDIKFQSSNMELRGAFSPSSGVRGPSILSMGMSTDYNIAIEQGSNMVRIGSLLFGDR